MLKLRLGHILWLHWNRSWHLRRYDWSVWPSNWTIVLWPRLNWPLWLFDWCSGHILRNRLITGAVAVVCYTIVFNYWAVCNHWALGLWLRLRYWLDRWLINRWSHWINPLILSHRLLILSLVLAIVWPWSSLHS